MGENSSIEWTDATWNPTVGCSVVSPGCTNCYAMKFAHRFSANALSKFHGLTKMTKGGPVWNGTVGIVDNALAEPLRWTKPKRIFVNSMSDLFHEALPDEAIDKVFAVMALCPQHTFQVLTKRAERMRAYLTARNGMGNAALCSAINAIPAGIGNRHGALEMPLPNVWLGVSIEDQTRADERIPLLLDTPAAVRFLSCEPLLGPVDLTRLHNHCGLGEGQTWLNALGSHGRGYVYQGADTCRVPRVDWVIAGGESGHGARPMDIGWTRSIVEQCKAAGVAVFVKQLGAWPLSMKKAEPFTNWRLADGPSAYDNGPFFASLKDRKGGDMAEWPEDLRVREFPKQMGAT